MRFGEFFFLGSSAKAARRVALWLALTPLLFGCARERFSEIRNLHSSGEAIICFGDSLTEGVGAGSGEDYPAVLSRELDRPVINAGVRGDTTASALARTADAVLARNPRLVIVLLGGNDFLRQVPRRITRENLESIVQRIQERGAMVALAGIRLGLFGDPYEVIFRETASKFGALYIPEVTKGIFSDATLRSDPIHPNHAGYRRMAERIGEKIKPLLAESDRLRAAHPDA